MPERKGFTITAQEATYLKTGGSLEPILQTAATKGTEVHKAKIHKVIADLIRDPHIQLVVSAAQAMGENEGITGKEYPPVMPFYLLAMRLSHLVETETLTDDHEDSGMSSQYNYMHVDPHKYRKCLY